MYNPQAKEFTVHLPSDAGPSSNTSSSFEVEFNQEKELDDHYDWYVATKELFLPAVQQPQTRWKGAITLYPTQTPAPFAAKPKKQLPHPLRPVTKSVTFQLSDVEGGKIFKEGKKTYTEGARKYLKKQLQAAGTVQDEWDWTQMKIIQRFDLSRIPDGETRDSNFVEPTDWGHIEFRGFFNSLFKLPRTVEPSLETHKAKWSSGYTPRNYMLIKDFRANETHRVDISPALSIGHLKSIDQQLKGLSLSNGMTIRYVSSVTGTFPIDGQDQTLTFNYPTFVISMPTAPVTSTSDDEIVLLRLYPAFYKDLRHHRNIPLNIKILNWKRCHDGKCVEVNEKTYGRTPQAGKAGYFMHAHHLMLGPVLGYYDDGTIQFYVPVIPPKNNVAAAAQLEKYKKHNRLQYNHVMPIALDMDLAAGSVEVDTRVECKDLLDYSQQYFTKPANTNLLRRIRRRLKEGNASDLEEIQFTNVLYHKVHEHVNKLKRLRIDISNENYDLGVTDNVSFPTGSKAMVALTFQPRRKRFRIADEHSFQINCNQVEPLKHPLILNDLPRLNLGLIDVWLTNRMWTVHENEMWFGLKVGSQTDIVADNAFTIPGGNYTDFEQDIIPMFRGLITKLKVDISIAKTKAGKWVVAWPWAEYAPMKLVFNDNMAEMMGHGKAQKEITLTTKEQEIAGSKGIDLYGGFKKLYLYCDMLEDTIVGNVEAPLLDCIVPKWDASGESYAEISNPTYIPLTSRVTQLDNLYIALTDSLGGELKYDQAEQPPRVTLSIKT